MFKYLKQDLEIVLEKDPAARSKWEVYFTYAGFRALRRHRRAHWFFNHNLKFLARCISDRTRRLTGIEIHPAAKIAHGVFIDHGTGIVIGETAEIGSGVVLYQGVTLGGTGKETGKRHPTICDNVMISTGAKILGPITIGEGCKIGAGSVVLKDVPPHCTVVGVPGRVVRQFGEKVSQLDQVGLPDPMMEEFKRLNERISLLEKELHIKSCSYSITNEISTEELLNGTANDTADQDKKGDSDA